ncbi:Hypothetical protein HDN1F_29490 [gamma proteobacterium HdN1]|nr:Hypothetical protein HDN1F_29490 [gamma proteobacterium HdN1]
MHDPIRPAPTKSDPTTMPTNHKTATNAAANTKVRTAFILMLCSAATLLTALSTGTVAAAAETTPAPTPSSTTQPPAERLVSLSPHTTEYVYFLGAGDRLVGAVDFSDYPDAAQKLPRVGGYNSVSLEKALALSPDLVLVWTSGNAPVVLEALRERHIPLFESDPLTVNDIATELRTLAKQIHVGPEAEEKIAAFENAMAKLRAQYSTHPKVRVFYQVWDKPLYTLGGQHFFNDLLKVCGGENIYADTAAPAPIVSIESVLSRQPDIIVASASNFSQENIATDEAKWRAQWQRWQQIPAVKHQQMYLVDADIFVRTTPRALDAAVTLCQLLEKVREQGNKKGD